MATSTTTTASSLTAPAGCLPRKGQVNAGLPKPKLTGWAQAAARALPKAAPPPPAPAAAQYRGSPPAGLLPAKKTKKQTNYRPRQPYNREEVRVYMKQLFSQYASSRDVPTYSSMGKSRKGSNLDWGAVTNNKYRNKKYGCLNEIAQALRN